MASDCEEKLKSFTSSGGADATESSRSPPLGSLARTNSENVSQHRDRAFVEIES